MDHTTSQKMEPTKTVPTSSRPPASLVILKHRAPHLFSSRSSRDSRQRNLRKSSHPSSKLRHAILADSDPDALSKQDDLPHEQPSASTSLTPDSETDAGAASTASPSTDEELVRSFYELQRNLASVEKSLRAAVELNNLAADGDASVQQIFDGKEAVARLQKRMLELLSGARELKGQILQRTQASGKPAASAAAFQEKSTPDEVPAAPVEEDRVAAGTKDRGRDEEAPVVHRSTDAEDERTDGASHEPNQPAEDSGIPQ